MTSSSLPVLHPRYDLIEKIGEGGVGIVYRAWDKIDRSTVVIKQAPASTINDTLRDAYWREFEWMFRAHHPGMMKALAWEKSEDGGFFFTMQLAAGIDLFQKIKDRGFWTKKRFDSFIRQIVSALSYVHAHGMVHGDIKPENILIESAGEDCKVTLIDFGFIHAWSNTPVSRDHQGTLAYTAPEILKKEPYDQRSDAYALGVVLYELATGINPFADENVVNIVVHHLQKNITHVDSDFEWWSQDYEKIIVSLLSKDPRQRYPRLEDAFKKLTDQNAVLPPLLCHRFAEPRSVWPDISAQLQTDHPTSVVLRAGEGLGATTMLRELYVRAIHSGYSAQYIRLDQAASLWEVLSGFVPASVLETLSDTDRAIEEILKTIAPNEIYILDQVRLDVPGVMDFLSRFTYTLSSNSGSVILSTTELQTEISFPAKTFVLKNLEPQDVKHFLSTWLFDEDVDEKLVSRMTTWTNGHPGLLYEATRELMEKRQLVFEERSWRLTPTAEWKPSSDWSEKWEAKIKALTDDEIRLIRWMAVADNEIPVLTLTALMENAGAEQNIPRLELFGWIRRKENAVKIVAPGLRAFLIQKETEAERRAMHDKLLSWYEKNAADAVPQLAYHAFEGNNQEKSVPYKLQWAEREVSRWNYAEALRQYENVLPLIVDAEKQTEISFAMELLADHLSDRKLQNALLLHIEKQIHSPHPRFVSFIIRRALYLERTGQPDEGVLFCQKHLESDVIKAKQDRARIRRQIGKYKYQKTLFTEARSDFEEAAHMAGETDDITLQMECQNSLGTVYGSLGEYALADKAFREVLRLARKTEAMASEVSALFNLGQIAFRCGALLQALTWYDEAANLLSLHPNNSQLLRLYLYRASARIRLRQFEMAFEELQSATAKAMTLNDRTALQRILQSKGVIYQNVGLYELAQSELLQAIEVGQNTNPLNTHIVKLEYSHVLFELGDRVEAHRYCKEAILFFEEKKEDVWLCYAQSVNQILHEYDYSGDETWLQLDALSSKIQDYSVRLFAQQVIAQSLVKKGNYDEALIRLQKVVAEIENQHQYDYSESPIHWLHYRILRTLHKPRYELAKAMDNAYRTMQADLDKLHNPAWRTAYENISLHSTIRAAYEDFFKEERETDIRSFQQLYEITRDINSILDPEKLFEKIMDGALFNARADRGLILLRNEETGGFDVRVARNVDSDSMADLTTISQSIVDEVYASGASMVTSDANSDMRFKERKSIVAYQIRSILCVPLKLRDHIIGAVYVDKRFDTHYFNSADLKFMEAFAHLAAIAISNAQDYEKVQSENDSLIHENLDLRKAVEERFTRFNIIGKSKAVDQIYRMIEHAAKTDAPVLITGESGTGKELVARAVHHQSLRRRNKFVAVDCGAVTESLLESELFGYKKGAFTGAFTDKKGLFEEADGGTIFLDEITNTTLSFQSRLLRVLQEQEIRRVGDTIPRKIDVRVVAATNKDVRQLITDGQFREDLFFRISVIPVFLAPLRERREDIPLLIKYFVEKYTQPGRMMEGLFGDALQILTDHDWPGNIRELENTVQRLMIFSGKSKLGPSDVRKAMQPSAAPLKSLEDFEKNLFESERKYFERVLDHVGGNKSKAAEWLGIKRTTLNDRLKKLGIS